MSETPVRELNSADLSVGIGFPCGANIPWQTALSLARTVRACAQRNIDCEVHFIAGASLVTVARDVVLDQFLKGKRSRLFWIDSDIVWTPDDFLRLLMLSTTVDVVGGAYPTKTEKKTFVIRHPDLRTFERNAFGCVKVHGMGLGFTVMTREVVERVAASKRQVYTPAANGDLVADVFRLDTTHLDGRESMRGEDMAFFADIRELGYDVWLDPTLKLGHVGTHVFQADPAVALGLA